MVTTPYGATECLPVATTTDDDILTRTQSLTDAGHGVVSEIVVAGDRVTERYDADDEKTAAAKIIDERTIPATTWHRMGDVGYVDDGLLWFCGRKSHRVRLQPPTTTTTPERGVELAHTAFTETVEGVFLGHPSVRRAALVGVPRPNGSQRAILCIEPLDFPWPWQRRALRTALLAQAHPLHRGCAAAPVVPRRHPPQLEELSRAAGALGGCRHQRQAKVLPVSRARF